VKTKVDVALRQAFGCAICPLCKMQLLPEHKRILEHMVPFAWTQGHITEDLAWVHKECADKKTYGNKATCADGDIHKIAKANRIARGGRKVRHPMRQHPTLKRTVGGKVVER
jgi:hypothetical protein